MSLPNVLPSLSRTAMDLSPSCMYDLALPESPPHPERVMPRQTTITASTIVEFLFTNFSRLG